MLAVLSPAYFRSEWCKKEYDVFRDQQLKKLYPGDSLHAIYISEHPDFDSEDDHPQRAWFEELKKRQFTDAKQWWPEGQSALQQEVVTDRLRNLRECIWQHVCDARAIHPIPSNLSDFNTNFVGREKELVELWNTLRLDQGVAISAIQGIGGLGKTALAYAYAHSRRREYPGGQFQIAMENIDNPAGLQQEIIRLGNQYFAANVSEELVSTNFAAAFAQAKAAFERPGQGKILLILDNVAHDGILSRRTTSLPSSEFVHVLATTRLDPESWGLKPLRLESLSTGDALDLFLKYRPFELPADEEEWHRVRNNQTTIAEPEIDSDQWKAAVGIVNRLGCHALAVEIVAVYLGHNMSISLKDYLAGMIRKGLSLKLDQAGDDSRVRSQLSEAIETNIGELLEPTFVRLEQENPLAMRALQWAALMPPDDVPWSWLQTLLESEHGEQLQHDPDDPDPWQDGIVRLLLGWRLLSGDIQQPTARMHRIVGAAIVARDSPTTAGNSQPRATLVVPSAAQRRYPSQLGAAWRQLGVGTLVCGRSDSDLIARGASGSVCGSPNRATSTERAIAAGNINSATSHRAGEITKGQRAGECRLRPQSLRLLQHRMGDLFRALGDGVEARKFYEQALEVS